MPELLMDIPEDYELKAVLLRNDGTQYVYDCDYEVGNRKLSFPLPAQNLESNVAYRLDIAFLKEGTYQPYSTGNSIDLNSSNGGMNTADFTGVKSGVESLVSDDSPVRISLHTLYFRVSDYDRLSDKMQEIKNAPVTEGIFSRLQKHADIEIFDDVDLSMMEYNPIVSNDWFNNNFKNTVYGLTFPLNIMGYSSSECVFKLPNSGLLKNMAGIRSDRTVGSSYRINNDDFVNGWNGDYLGTQVEFSMGGGVNRILDGIQNKCDKCMEYIINYGEFYGEDTPDYMKQYMSSKLYDVYSMSNRPLSGGIYKVRIKYTLPGNILVREATINFNY
jgi:hypothetical protein